MVEVSVNPNAPRVVARFLMHAIHNPVKSKKEGRPIYDEIEGCEIWVPGSRTVGGNVFPAHETADWSTDPLTGEKVERTYAQKYNAEYLAFKSGDASAVGGTPLEELPFLTQAKRLELKALHINTAEALAALDGNNLKMLGMGGRELKTQAETYIETAKRGTDAAYLKTELDKTHAQMATMQAELAALKAGATEGQKHTAAAVAANQQTQTDTATTEVASVETSDPALASTIEAFKDFQDDDLKGWLEEAQVKVDGRWGRGRMIQEAKLVLDAKGKKKAE